MTTLWLFIGFFIGCLWMGLSVFAAVWWSMTKAYRDEEKENGTASY